MYRITSNQYKWESRAFTKKAMDELRLHLKINNDSIESKLSHTAKKKYAVFYITCSNFK